MCFGSVCILCSSFNKAYSSKKKKMGLVLDCLAMSWLGKFLLSIIKIKIRHISLLGTIGLFLGPYSR